MTWKIHWMMAIPIRRLPCMAWRMRVSSCLISPCHHLGGRMFGQMTLLRKFELLAHPLPTIVGVVSTFLL